jgi:hypothetical protein
MPQPETRAWWSDVQHLRDSIERKREDEARRGLRLDARSAARAVADRDGDRTLGEPAVFDHDVADPTVGERPLGDVRVQDAPLPDDLDWVTRPQRRFARSAPDPGGRFARPARERGEPQRGDEAPQRHERPRQPHDRAPEDAPRALEASSHRRTVEITGRTVGAPTLPRLVQIDRRRPARRPVERVGPRPDRLALWAVVLGFFLILVAVTSTSHAATRAPSARAVDGHTAHVQIVRAHTATLRATPPAR